MKNLSAAARDSTLCAVAVALSAIFVLFVVVALVALVLRASPQAFADALRSPIVSQALWLSLKTSAISALLIAVCGTPLAALLSRPFRGRHALETLVTLPVVLPPVVGGLALLLAFGRAGLLGRELELFGVHLPFTTAAVILAQTFVAAPLYIAVAKSAFARVDPDLIDAAATLRASRTYTFARVIIPPALPALAGGLALAWRGARRIRRDDHLCRQHARGHADDADRRLHGGADGSAVRHRRGGRAHGAVVRRAARRASRGRRFRARHMTLQVDIEAHAGEFPVSCRFDVHGGRSIALVGSSGAGKTTVLRTIAGLLRPDRGRIVWGEQVWFDGQRGVFMTPQRRDCAMVFAEHALFGHMSAIENVAFGLRASGHAGDAALTGAHEALEIVGVASLGPRKASSLSSGEAQRVAIARALAVEPHVLLLDEPLSAIDVERRPPVRDALQRIVAQAGIATVLVTHDPVEAMLFSDSLIVMEAGAVAQRGSPAELRARPLTSYVAAFAGVNLFRGSARPLEGGVSAVDVEGATLVIPGTVSGLVALVIDPDSVVLSHARPESSARNSLYGPVVGIVPDGPALRVSVASAPPIVARITRRSADELGLAGGALVHATFKASEVRVH